MLTTVVNSLLGYGFWLVAARMYPPAMVGLSAALISAGTLVSLVASMGVASTLVQSLPEQDSPEHWAITLWTGMVVAAATCVVADCLVLLVLPIASGQFSLIDRPAAALVFVVGTAGLTAGSILDAAFVAERGSGNMLSRNSVVAVAKLLALVVAAFTLAREVLTVMGTWAVAAALGFVVGVALLFRRVGVVSRPSVRSMRGEARHLQSRVFGNQLIGIGAQMPNYVLPLVVTARLSASQNAYFYTTWMMCGIFLIISPAVSTSLFAEGVHSPREMLSKSRTTLAAIGVLLAPSMVIFFIFGGILLSTFRTSYEVHGLLLMRLVVLAAIPDAITNVYVAVLRVQQRLAAAAWLNLGMGVGTVAIAWAVLPELGISAVGWAWMALQGGGSVWVAIDIARRRWASPRELRGIGG
jgi:O-antigen/teichoic acid export membrane protein